jgi:magnesium transporter
LISLNKTNDRTNRNRKRKRSRHRGVPGAAPGTVVSDPNSAKTVIRVLATSPGTFFEQEITDISDLSEVLARHTSVWIEVTGLGSADKIVQLGELLGLHSLALEDVVNVHQRAKMDAFQDYLFVVARMFDTFDTSNSEQISFFLKKNLVLSFQERPGDCWENIRQRLRMRHGKIATLGPDYLLYVLLDAIIDSYFPVMDRLSDEVDALEDQITAKAQTKQMHQVHQLRGQLLDVRRAIRPHREMISAISHHESHLIEPETHVYFRDCYDHVIQVIDSVDTYRELTSDLRDYYLSMVSNSMNEVMKLLTIISTIFIPLSFVAGVYGMNFDTESPWNMPELRWQYGYPFALTVMGIIGFGLAWSFRRRGWL